MGKAIDTLTWAEVQMQILADLPVELQAKFTRLSIDGKKLIDLVDGRARWSRTITSAEITAVKRAVEAYRKRQASGPRAADWDVDADAVEISTMTTTDVQTLILADHPVLQAKFAKLSI